MTGEGVLVAGIDGCKSGWFFIAVDEHLDFDFGVERNISKVVRRLASAKLILIDIPIGLPSQTHAKRICDTAARTILGRRGSSVFPVPARSALTQASYEAACDENERVLGKRLSKQSWAIAPKIREVDEFMRKGNHQGKIREMHPEVAFAYSGECEHRFRFIVNA